MIPFTWSEGRVVHGPGWGEVQASRSGDQWSRGVGQMVRWSTVGRSQVDHDGAGIGAVVSIAS